MLNKVRERAGVPLYGSAAYPSAQYPSLDLAIEHERRVELAIEFQRGFDLRRTNRAVPVLGAKGKPVTAEKLLLPYLRLSDSKILLLHRIKVIKLAALTHIP
ncbi:RagB/SusD family nutrient uptake outer membrane protein [Arcticibacter sp. MXS-1]|uniref:RagB/SusD family nutrient uptake outer membrane protein n=1 Tax=Arcticibacter sp. MXS-1 TaxID=3341726 RepID=UPI0035A8E3F6